MRDFAAVVLIFEEFFHPLPPGISVPLNNPARTLFGSYVAIVATTDP
jgi:hypothetical protein